MFILQDTASLELPDHVRDVRQLLVPADAEACSIVEGDLIGFATAAASDLFPSELSESH